MLFIVKYKIWKNMQLQDHVIIEKCHFPAQFSIIRGLYDKFVNKCYHFFKNTRRNMPIGIYTIVVLYCVLLI